LGQIICLHNPDVSLSRFYHTLSSLEDQGLVEHKIVPKTLEQFQINEYQYRKLASGKRVEIKGFSFLERIFLPLSSPA
jgi:DNA-binding PadR family transcriptional regulator